MIKEISTISESEFCMGVKITKSAMKNDGEKESNYL